MEIEYEITLDDMVAFNVYHIRNSPSCRRSRLLVRAILPLGMFPVFLHAGLTGEGPLLHSAIASGFLWVSISFIWLLVTHCGWRRGLRRKLVRLYREGEAETKIVKHVMTLGPEGITDKTELAETKRKWRGLKKIVSDDKHIYLYVGPAEAHIVPKGVFPDESSIEGFLAAIEAFRGNEEGA